ncbi:zinc-binding alcohol dehydrogenase [Roseiarcaceae bacterium H3SJ34-1]|uniref:zinc-dependent alcohol dehydrogenase n=1 Tax=Terripilifer ovatus TaxID=3032367 RepID=UPI003AB9428A|nr:zinc-binding alcohol dehydrogenase [Roseiarcaceae bacterium H3SJ34-1]
MAVDTKMERGKAAHGVEALSLWYTAPGRAEIRPAWLSPADGYAQVRTLWSAISRGTERLVMEGRVPALEAARMRAPMQEGDFPFPVKYGYCAVGKVEAGPAEMKGRLVYALHPHQTRFAAPLSLLTPLPNGLDPRRAAIAANMETALNAVWDAGAGPGDRITIVGAGLVGLLVAYLCARLPGADVCVIDIDGSRGEIARSFGARFAQAPDAAIADADVVFHASASAAGLATAVGLGGLEARIVEMSWYGEGEIAVPLGGAFHSRRLQLVSSQVGQVSPSRRPRWDYGRRMRKALDLLGDERLDALITHEFFFDDLPQQLPAFLGKGAAGLAAVVKY